MQSQNHAIRGFDGCENLKTIVGLDNLNTSECTDMSEMFWNCKSLDNDNLSDLSKFDTRNVINMNFMFCSCVSITSLDLSAWDTQNVVTMMSMFEGCSSLKDINLGGKFNTQSVEVFASMFSGCTGLETIYGLNNFNTSNCTSLHRMFQNCSTPETLDLTSFNTVKVREITSMFEGCSNLKTIVVSDKWDISNIYNTSTTMFDGCTNLVGGKGTTYDENKITAAYAHIDGGPDNPGYLTAAVPYTVYDNGTLTFYFGIKPTEIIEHTVFDVIYYDGNGAVPTVPWTSWHKNDIISVSFDASFKNYQLTEYKSVSSFCPECEPTYYCGCGEWFYECVNLESINGLENLDVSKVRYFNKMFYGCSKLKKIDLNINTSSAISMASMFLNCTELENITFGDEFTTTNVKSISFIFAGCKKLTTIDLKKFTTLNLTEQFGMSDMFYDCQSLIKLDLSSFILGDDIKDMSRMFGQCYSLTEIKFGTGFNTSSVEDFSQMFEACQSLTTLDLSGFDTQHVTDMSSMFNGCSSLTTLDLRSFNTKNVTNMGSMFSMKYQDPALSYDENPDIRDNNKLTTIIVGENWKTASYNSDMFKYCHELIGGNGTKCDGENDIDGTYAKIDDADGDAGYFTKLPYTISYYEKLDEGEPQKRDDETTFSPGDPQITLKEPSKEGYTFIGWTEIIGKETIQHSKYDEITINPSTDRFNRKYIANYEKIPALSVNLTDEVNYPLDHDKYCNNQEPSAKLSFTIDEKSPLPPTNYTITFGNNTISGDIPPNSNTIEIPMDGVSRGEYDATIQFFDNTNTATPTTKSFKLKANIPPKDVILYLYHNVIFVNNHDLLFSKYQWRKDGKDIVGATRQYYTERPELTGTFTVLITPFVGDPVETCPFPTGVSVKKSATDIKVYPNPATAGKGFNVEILDYVADTNYKILIFSNEGSLVKTISTRERITEVSLPHGIFTIALTANGEKCGYFKILVEK